MKIYDGHFHIEKGVFEYTNPKVTRKNVIFNYCKHYLELADKVPETDSISLIFDYKENFDLVANEISTGKINALKIHSRIQQIDENGYGELIERLTDLNPKLPIILDAFYFGDDYQFQPNLKEAIRIAKKFPHVPIIIAHSGGYEVLKYFYHMKTLPNVFFCLALSITYLKNTSVYIDFLNLIKYLPSERVLYGTDFPYIDPKAHLDNFIEITEQLNMKQDAIDNILYNNAMKLFKEA